MERGSEVTPRAPAETPRYPPLGTAAFVRSVPLSRLLLDAGADVNGQGEGGFTALHAAAANGDEDLVQLLLERGADATLLTAQGKRPADLVQTEALRTLLRQY